MELPDINESVQPPVLISRLLNWSLPAKLKEPILGDLTEEFVSLSQIRHNYAIYWYYRQCIRTAINFIWMTKKELMMFIMSLLFFVLVSFFAFFISTGGNMLIFIDVPSMIIIFPTAIILSIGTTSLKDFKYAFWSLLAEKDDIDRFKAQSATRIFSVMGNSALLIAMFSVLIGWVAIITHSKIESYELPFAVSLISMLYGFFVKIFCYIAEQRILHKLS